MKRRLRRLVTIFMFVLFSTGLLLVLTASSTKEEVKGSAVEIEEWVVPHLAPLSGPYAGFGLECMWACQYAIEEINASGGCAGKPMRMTEYDGAGDPHKSVAAMSRILDTKPLVMVGPHITPTITAVGPMLVESEVYSLAAGAGADSTSPFFPWVYTTLPWQTTLCGAGVKYWAEKNPDMKKVVPLRDVADEWYKNCVMKQTKVLESMGLEVTPVVTFDLKATVDFGPTALAALNNDPDGVFFVSVGDPVAKTIVELHRRGFKDHSKIFVHAGADYPGFFEIGKGYLDGIYMSGFYNPQNEGERWKAIQKAYAQDHDLPAGFGCYVGMDLPYLIKDAIESTGVTGDPKKLKEERVLIRDWLNNQKGYPFVMGNFDIIDGVAMYPIFIFRIENNQKKYLGVSSLGE